MKAFVLAVGLTMAAWSSACLNDIDSITRTYADTIKASTGWFMRHPPLYYQMRIDRILGLSKKRALTPEEYNDISVAYDHLGNDDEAIRWISQKGERLSQGKFEADFRSGTGEYRDYDDEKTFQEYSLHANWGTFIFHRWLKAGMPKERINEAKDALNHIAKAVEVNPDGHSGREWVQKGLMKWIIDKETAKAAALPKFDGDSKSIQEGLAGLVELGSAWESYDVFALMTYYGDAILLCFHICVRKN